MVYKLCLGLRFSFSSIIGLSFDVPLMVLITKRFYSRQENNSISLEMKKFSVLLAVVVLSKWFLIIQPNFISSSHLMSIENGRCYVWLLVHIKQLVVLVLQQWKSLCNKLVRFFLFIVSHNLDCIFSFFLLSYILDDLLVYFPLLF